ncbi:hypothetical protein PRZ48_004019 [Zasmidium cellare]|uniref:Aminotransferase class I/classII large domain-containing protein n=1 Tax=Zasmidium cellare TaxID=395010 RepID=A0ABR0EXG6_ZASCE|nr:hypothetical protein PRZ48_004019 [Zasmidium cellare]
MSLLHLVRDFLWPKPTQSTMSTNFSSLPAGMSHSTSKPAINLLRGWPNGSLLPVALIKAAAQSALSDPSIAYDGLVYGPDEGYQPAREAIAAWLTSFYNPSRSIDAERICLNGGASQSLGCMLNVYTDPSYTRNIWLVAPAYMLVFRIFEDAGFGDKMRAVPEDEDGIDIAYLRQEIQKSEDIARKEGNDEPRYKPSRGDRAKVYKHIVYCVPTFSNPSSRTMTISRRRELVRLARDFDVLIVCDDVYDFLQWPASDNVRLDTMKTSHLPRLVDIDRELDGGADRQGADGFGNVMSNGTFSKLAGPGLRSGWIEGTAKFSYGVSQAGIQRSGGAPSQLTSTYLTHLLQTGQLQHHIQNVLRPAYATRYSLMASAIKEHLLPLGFTMPQPDREVVGGYFIWLGLPETLNAEELTQRCQDEESLIIAPGRIFEVPGDESLRFERSVRLCFASEEEGMLGEGVRRMGGVARRMLERGDGEYVVVERGNRDDSKLQGFM